MKEPNGPAGLPMVGRDTAGAERGKEQTPHQEDKSP